MADKDRTIVINAVADNGPKGVKFSMTHDGVATNDLEFDKNKDGMKKADFYKISFELNDTSGLNLRYVSKKDDAMWVHRITDPSNYNCPPSGSSLPGFSATNVTNTVLTVKNKDECVEFLAFALNFVKPGDDDTNEANYIQYDPIVTNKNGGTNLQANVVVIAIVAVAAVAAVAVLISS